MRHGPVCWAHYVLRWIPLFFKSQLSFLKEVKVDLSDQHAFCLCVYSIETVHPVGSMREKPTALNFKFPTLRIYIYSVCVYIYIYAHTRTYIYIYRLADE